MAIKKKASDQALVDRQTVKEILGGDTKGFQKLMDRYYDIIFFTILKMVHNKKVTEELTLEVFSKAYQKLNSYSDEFAFSTWLFTIASNRGIDYIRKKKPNTVVIDDENKDDYETVVLASEHQQQPDELLMKQQKAVELRALVDELKPFWQDLIDMRYYQELSYEEISENLKIPLGTIKNQLHRAKRKLSEIADKKGKNDLRINNE